jgi:hypothetical protein
MAAAARRPLTRQLSTEDVPRVRRDTVRLSIISNTSEVDPAAAASESYAAQWLNGQEARLVMAHTGPLYAVRPVEELAETVAANTSLNIEVIADSIPQAALEAVTRRVRSAAIKSVALRGVSAVAAAGFGELMRAIAEKPSVTSLSVEGDLLAINANALWLQQLCECLRAAPHLASLRLCVESLSADATNALGEAVRAHRKLTSLNLSCSRLGPEGGRVIAAAIAQHPSLQKLDLSNNGIGPQAAALLAQALSSCPAIENVKLCWNDIGDDEGDDEGVESLAECIEQHATLRKVDLRWNSVGLRGATRLKQALSVNTQVEALLSVGNASTETAGLAESIAQALAGRGLAGAASLESIEESASDADEEPALEEDEVKASGTPVVGAQRSARLPLRQPSHTLCSAHPPLSSRAAPRRCLCCAGAARAG